MPPKKGGKAEAEPKGKGKAKAEDDRDDKKITEKDDKKKKEEEKKQQDADRRRAAKEALEAEEAALASSAKKAPKAKVTQAEIQKMKDMEAAKAQAADKKKDKPAPIPENINHVIAREKEKHGDDYLEARTVDDAVKQLSGSQEAEKHPEKRLKAAFAAYEDVNLPILRKENPGLKLSQVKELLWKQWQKSPENPLNQTA
eukprot:TRINITY_DN850_c0_g2_i1.p1 TRINITY_DN850_c0_g2~~TRINITY_DN850_c0_g2_i1.p1  ORF type:complete len:200 (+),score=101.04 TRINITY_DN850_c0_g2_i1:1229-1828(+)